PTVLYFAAGNALYILPRSAIHLSSDATYYIVFSVLALVVVAILNIVGLDVGTWLHNLGALAMWVPVAIIVFLGLIAWHRFGSASSFASGALVPSFRLQDVLFWSLLIFAFAGIETASFMGDEIMNQRRSIPLALFTPVSSVVFFLVRATVT